MSSMNNENRCWTGLTVRSAWAVGILCSLLGCGGNKSPSDADVEAGPSCTATSADDEPDVAGTDANCDGVDGVVTDAVFVDAARGSDASAGTREAPVASVGKGIEVAVENGKHMVLLAAGTYSGTVTLADGISIHGGYEPTDGWARPALTTRSPVTILTATSSPVVLGESIASATRISGVGVTGPNVSAYGVSSVAMRLVDSAGLTLEDCELRAGTGGPGATGATPAQSTIVGTAGGPGLISKCYGPAANCDHNSPTFTAQSLSRTAAVCGGCGRGGIGSWAWADDTVTRNGGPGDSWNGTACVDSGSSGPGSAGQATGPTPATGPGGLAGAPGAPGAPGVGATSAGAITEGGFVTVLAESGGQGSVGGGGGGGSAGAYRGCPAPDDGNFLVGGTGAYGGSGGCGGAGGGGGGLAAVASLLRSFKIADKSWRGAAAFGGPFAAIIMRDGGRSPAPISVNAAQ